MHNRRCGSVLHSASSGSILLNGPAHQLVRVRNEIGRQRGIEGVLLVGFRWTESVAGAVTGLHGRQVCGSSACVIDGHSEQVDGLVVGQRDTAAPSPSHCTWREVVGAARVGRSGRRCRLGIVDILANTTGRTTIVAAWHGCVPLCGAIAAGSSSTVVGLHAHHTDVPGLCIAITVTAPVRCVVRACLLFHLLVILELLVDEVMLVHRSVSRTSSAMVMRAWRNRLAALDGSAPLRDVLLLAVQQDRGLPRHDEIGAGCRMDIGAKDRSLDSMHFLWLLWLAIFCFCCCHRRWWLSTCGYSLA
mmetsp:Transcript_8633/g.24849  ORF Transcript_8633/g.24849 Transcript_8633/m.24849 type:complete len:303 (+) Transcript_8633:106-1014(+)